MLGYIFGSKKSALELLCIGLFLCAAAGAAESTPTTNWEKLEREFFQYTALEHQAQLERWQGLSNNDPDLSIAKKNEAHVLHAGKTELARLITANSNLGTSWSEPILKRMKAYLKNGKVPAAEKLSDTQQTALLKTLWQIHPEPTNLTALEWKTISTLYGNEVSRAFLLSAFTPNTWNNRRAPASTKPMFYGNTAEVVYIEGGHQWLASGSSLQAIVANVPRPDVLKTDVLRLEALGMKVHKITLSTFPKFDDQAHELQHSLSALREKTDAPLLLLSSGIASAVVYRWLDIYPQNRDREDLKAWINWNGRLYGASLSASAEKTLSQAEQEQDKKRSPASEADWFLAASLLQPQVEASSPAMPLGPGFPIFNFITLNNNDLAPDNLREAIVPEGAIIVAHEKWSQQDLPALVRRALNP